MDEFIKIEDKELEKKIFAIVGKMQKYCEKNKKEIEKVSNGKFSIQVTLNFMESKE